VAGRVGDPTTRPEGRRHHIHSVGGFLKTSTGMAGRKPCPQARSSTTTHHTSPHTPLDPQRLMCQLEDSTDLARFPSDDGRVLLQLLMACGL
jgi:hypothetical protein